jgi:DNA mismatch repair protein MutS
MSTKPGSTSLKIRHNNVLGYFIDVTTAQAENMPTGDDSPFIHRQTLASAMRFTTVELGELEGKLAQAGERALAMELELFDDLVTETTARAEVDFHSRPDALAMLDVAAALRGAGDRPSLRAPAWWTRGTRLFDLRRGRHPVVEAALAARPATARVCRQ